MLPADLLTLSASMCYSVASTDLVRRSGALDVLHFSLLMHTCCNVSMVDVYFAVNMDPLLAEEILGVGLSWTIILLQISSDLSKFFECHDPRP